jgi:SAM-dependent methyltransferase
MTDEIMTIDIDRFSVSTDRARAWIERWDRQQERYVPEREALFDLIADAVSARCGRAARIVDLGCGPGSLGTRLAARLPDAHVIGVDYDPVLLSLAKAAHRGDPRRIWIDADLRQARWVDALDGERIDAVVSTTALHWLGADELTRLYRQLRQAVLVPGGIFLDGDHLTPGPDQPIVTALAADHKAQRFARSAEALDWSGWWDALRRDEPSLAGALDTRTARYANRRPEEPITAAFHRAALRQAGFQSAELLWRRFDWVLVAALAPSA